MIAIPSDHALDFPSHAGKWCYWPANADVNQPFVVAVEEHPTSGRFCRELKMGGCAQMGYSEWSGVWEEANDV